MQGFSSGSTQPQATAVTLSHTAPAPRTHLSPLEIEALLLTSSPALGQAGLDLSQPRLHVLQLHLQILGQLGRFHSLWVGWGAPIT